MKKQHDTNATEKTKMIAHLMITAKQLILYMNALSQPLLIKTKYTQEKLKETSKKDTIIIRHSKTEKRQITHPLEICMGSKEKIQRNTVFKVCPMIFKYHQEEVAMSS